MDPDNDNNPKLSYTLVSALAVLFAFATVLFSAGLAYVSFMHIDVPHETKGNGILTLGGDAGQTPPAETVAPAATPDPQPTPATKATPSPNKKSTAAPSPTAPSMPRVITPSQTPPPPDPPVPPSREPTTDTVLYTTDCYVPQTLTINSGDTIDFENYSNTDMWPASNNHPTHTIYPEFDARQPFPNGETFSFKFDRPGTWTYHDHLNPGCTATVIVQ